MRGYKINPNLIREIYNIKLPEDYKQVVLQNNNARPGLSAFDTKNSKGHVFKKLLSLNKSDLETNYKSYPYGINLYSFGIGYMKQKPKKVANSFLIISTSKNNKYSSFIKYGIGGGILTIPYAKNQINEKT